MDSLDYPDYRDQPEDETAANADMEWWLRGRELNAAADLGRDTVNCVCDLCGKPLENGERLVHLSCADEEQFRADQFNAA